MAEIIKEQKGYSIGEYYKNGKFKCFISASYDYNDEREYVCEGITGFGDLYYSKKECQKDVDKLNKIWGYKSFKCIKTKLIEI